MERRLTLAEIESVSDKFSCLHWPMAPAYLRSSSRLPNEPGLVLPQPAVLLARLIDSISDSSYSFASAREEMVIRRICLDQPEPDFRDYPEKENKERVH